MSSNEQLYETLFRDGTLLMSIDYYKMHISLYSLGLILYEVYQHELGGEIVKITVAEYRDLDKFVGSIGAGLI